MTTLSKDSSSDALAPLDGELRTWLRANADNFDFERWQGNAESAPWNALEFPSLPALKVAVINSGSHWFDKSTLRFFNSKTVSGLLGRRFFITSEYMEDPAEVRYSVRWFHAYAGSDMLQGSGLEFQKFATLAEAKAAVTILQGICATVTASLEGK